MGVLRTIVATAVIVFALTTVAMAGVQHLAKSGQTAAQTQQPKYTVTLTDKQLAKLLLASQKQVATHSTKHVQRHTQKHVQRHTQKHAEQAHHTYAATHTADYRTSQGSAGSTGYRSGYRCNSSSNNNCWDHNGGSSGSHSGHGGCD